MTEPKDDNGIGDETVVRLPERDAMSVVGGPHSGPIASGMFTEPGMYANDPAPDQMDSGDPAPEQMGSGDPAPEQMDSGDPSP